MKRRANCYIVTAFNRISGREAEPSRHATFRTADNEARRLYRLGFETKTTTVVAVPPPPRPSRRRTDREVLYETWAGMRSRCFCESDPGYVNYGARGITVCVEWSDFEKFAEFMGSRPGGKTIDRINNNGNYEPGNVRWATPTEQARNTRANRNLTAFGKTQCLAAWVDEFGIKRSVLTARLDLGMSDEAALTSPTPRQKAAERSVARRKARLCAAE